MSRPEAGAGLDSPRRLIERREALRTARDVMQGLGVTWQQVRAWALVDGGFMPADAPLRCPNPALVDAYAAQVEP